VRGFVRTGSIFRFTAGALTPASVLSTYVLTNLADDGLSWLTLGTDEFGIPCRATKIGGRFHVGGHLQAAPRTVFQNGFNEVGPILDPGPVLSRRRSAARAGGRVGGR
jgi:hypothetical protein